MLKLIHITLDIAAILLSLTTAIEAILVFCRQKQAITLVFGISGICMAILMLISRSLAMITKRPHQFLIYINALAAIFYLATGIAFILELVQVRVSVDQSYAAFHFVIPIVFILDVAILSASITASLGKPGQTVSPITDEESTNTKVDFDVYLPPPSSRQSLSEKMSRTNSYPLESVLPDANDSRLLKMASEKTLIDNTRHPDGGTRHFSKNSGDIDQLVNEYLNSRLSITDIGAADSNWMDSGARLHSLNNGVDSFTLLRVGSSAGMSQSPSPVSDVAVKSRALVKRRSSSRSLLHKAQSYRNSPKRHRTISDTSFGFDKIASTLHFSKNEHGEATPHEGEESEKSPSNCPDQKLIANISLRSQSEYCEQDCNLQPAQSTVISPSSSSPHLAHNESSTIETPPTLLNFERLDDTASRLSTVGEIDTSADFKKKSSTALLVCTKEPEPDSKPSPIDEQNDIAQEYFASYTAPTLPLHPDLDNFSLLSDRLYLVDYFDDFNDAYMPGTHADIYTQAFKLPAVASEYRHELLSSESLDEYHQVLKGLETIPAPLPVDKNNWVQPKTAFTGVEDTCQWLENGGMGPPKDTNRGVRIRSGGDVFVYDRAEAAPKTCMATFSPREPLKLNAPPKEEQWMLTESSTMIYRPESEFSFAESANYMEPPNARVEGRSPSAKASFETAYPEPHTPTQNSVYDFVTPDASMRRRSESPIRALFRSSPRKNADAAKRSAWIYESSPQSCPNSARRSPQRRARHSSSQGSLASTISQYTGGSPKKAIRAALGTKGNHKKSLSMPSFPPPMFPVFNAGKLYSALDRRKTTGNALKDAEFKFPSDTLDTSEDEGSDLPLERVISLPGLIIGEYDREKWETLKMLRRNQNGPTETNSHSVQDGQTRGQNGAGPL